MESFKFVPDRYPPRRPSNHHAARLRNRITCAYSPEERRAIEWLNRTPARPELTGVLKTLRGQPRRTIAKTLSASQLARLVTIHQTICPIGVPRDVNPLADSP